MNFVTALGTSRDPTTSSTYNYVDLDRFTLENAYRSDWIARRVIDSPADDATREWRHWNASQNQIEALEAAENDLQLRKKVKQWIIRARLYGGAALVIGIDDGHESWEPLDLDNIGKDSLQFVVVMNRYELNAGPRIYNVSSRWYTRPEYYTVATPLFGFAGEPGEAYPGTSFSPLMVPQRSQGQSPPGGGGGQSNVVRLSRGPAGGFGGDPYKQVTPVSGMVRLHPSRVIELAGNELPDWRLAPMGGGWGDSVLQTVDESLKDWGLTVGAMANMVNDAKTDIIKVKDFAQKITTNEYQTRLLNRWALANISKSTVNALVLDKEEEWQRIQTNFGGLAELLREYMVVISGATNIPISRLFGQSSGRGLGAGSSGGEQDLKNYYDSVASWQRNTVTPVMEWLDQALIRSTLGGAKPGVYYEWAPLWQMSDTEKAEMALKKAQAYQIDVQMGQINEDALRHARISQLIEDGTYPGLDDAIDQYGEEPDVPEARLYSPGVDPVTGLPIAPGGAPKPPGGGGFGGGGSQTLPPAPSGTPPQPPKPAAVSRETRPAKDSFSLACDTDFFTDPDGSVHPIRGSEGYAGNGGGEERTTTPPPPDVKKGGMSHADVRAAADKVADKLGFDKSKIDVTGETKTFMLNGKEHNYAGGADLATGRVMLFSNHLSPEHIEGVVAHEIEHQKFQNALERGRQDADRLLADPGPAPKPDSENIWERRGGADAMMKATGELRPPYDEKYPHYTAMHESLHQHDSTAFSSTDGVSGYSADWWQAHREGTASYHQAVHETLAEMAKAKHTTGKFPEHYGGRLTRVRGEGAVRLTKGQQAEGERRWRNLYRAVDAIHKKAPRP